MDNLFFFDTPLGRMAIGEADGAIVSLLLPGEEAPENVAKGETALLRRAADQLLAYLAGERQDFELPLVPRGTPFQRAVWKALLEIPYGETRTYGEIAARVGKPRACRAVGMANHRNPIPILIPCHRVIGADGGLTGYGGGLACKEALLQLEKRHGAR